jgi:glutathione S-transferase
MKLYYMNGACSMAAHICLIEAGIKFEATGLDRKNRVFADGQPIDKVNSKGYVPVLQLDDGQLLTENVAVLLCVADLNPAAKLAPAAGTSLERYRQIEWLAFINSEIHKSFGPLFHPDSSDELKKWAIGNLSKRLGWLNTSLGSKKFVAAENFTAADAYLFTVLNWTPRVKVDLTQWPNIKRYHTELATRPSVIAAMKAEGLIKSG